MTHRFDSSFLARLAQTVLFTLGGFLLVSLLAQHSTMSYRELIIGPLALALMWLGMTVKTRPV